MPAVQPGAYNVVVKSHEASGKLVVDFARNISKFAVNQYVQIVPAKAITGYYLEFTVEEAARILHSDLRNFVWYDGDPAPTGRAIRNRSSSRNSAARVGRSRCRWAT